MMLLLITLLLAFFSSGKGTVSVCEDPPTLVGEQKVIIYGRKESSNWVTTVQSQFESEGTPERPNLEVGQKILKCKGKEIVQITAVLREHRDLQNISAVPVDVLRFHSSGGRNVRVSNNGLTVSRIKEEETDNAGILTYRPLQDDELFEVRLDRCLNRHSANIGIGISNNTPLTITYASWFSSGATMLYNNNIYGNHRKANYGPNLRTLKDGSQVGVRRKKNGDLHFYVNGADLGIAATGIASPVYGVFDLHGDCVQATIIDN